MRRVRSQDRLKGFDLKPERTFHRRLREARDTNNIQALVQFLVDMAEEQPMVVQEVAMPSIANVTSSIVKPRITGHFKLKQSMIQLLHANGQFMGLPHEDPQQHILNFLKFLAKFFPSGKTAKIRSEIVAFKQKAGESLYSAWERFKGLLKDCPHHNQTNEVLAHTFIEGLHFETNIVVDAAAGGQVQINIPLVNILQEVPKYAKYIKDIVANKRRLTEFEIVALTEECSSRIQGKLPQKLKDPGSFTIQISIGKHAVGRALCDLGASINLMPLSVFRQLGLGELRPTTVILQLADHSLAHPEGVIEDMLVQVGSFIFPTDFIILDYELDEEVPFILGHPFLATGRAIIDICEGRMTMRVGDQVEVFNVYRALKLPTHYEELSMISVVESDATSLVPYMSPTDPVEQVLIGDVENSEDEIIGEIEQVLDISCSYVHGFKKFEELERPATLTLPRPSIEEALKLELKPLPTHLRYAYLGNSEILPVTISSSLTHSRRKIAQKDGHRPSVEQQRRLNPIMKEVVKKEVIKLLDAGIIFPISDSNWVSPVQCVPKKGGMTVVENEKNELIPTRTVTGWRVCIDYRRLNKVSRKDHFPLPFIDQMLDRLLEKDVTFNFDACLKAFEELKKKLVTAPIIVAPDWSLPFELMCDASDLAIGAVLGQRKDKEFYSIYYASKTLDDAQLNYTTIEKELLAVVWAFEKFWAYLVGTKVIVHTDHAAIRLENHDHVKKGGQIKEVFPDEQLFAITQDPPPWYADYVNYLVSGVLPPEIQSEARKRFLHDVNFYYWYEPYLYKQCADQLMRRCIPENEVELVLYDCHASPYGAIMEEIEQLQWCYNPVSFGRLYSRMPMHSLRNVTNVREWVQSQGGMRCL
ncbi:uncharacterized protein LOC107806844 [Nicotiana tabacum]|uniref:Uncharacterized protein LOC107806844 n=1 Tax=Nicotiana tabacum TaxID=4097 RepID=A0AC58S6C9_TOBAC